MRAASPPRQMERENEMIVISHRIFCPNKLSGETKKKDRSARTLQEYGRGQQWLDGKVNIVSVDLIEGMCPSAIHMNAVDRSQNIS